MADQTLNPAEIVPKIVITEPSPLPVFNTGFVQNILPISDEVEVVVPTIAPVPEPPVTIVSKEDLVLEEPKVDEIVESVSVSASDADSCSVSVEKILTQEVEEVGLLVPPPQDEEVAEDEFRDVQEYGGLYESCWRCMDNFSESKFMLPVLIVLLVMPISAGFMGARYMDKCPLSNAAPLFLFMLGVLGTLVILCRMGLIAKRMAGAGSGDHKMLSTVVVFGNLAILLLLCTEMTSFLRMSPSFEPGTPNYCHRVFYNFTYWLNWTSLFVIVFLAVIHSPKCSRQTSVAENNA